MTSITPPPDPLKRATLTTSIISVDSVKVISTSDESFPVVCENLTNDNKLVQCSIQNSNHRLFNSVLNATYSGNNFDFSGAIINMVMNISNSYQISKASLGIPEQQNATRPTLPENVTLSEDQLREIEERSSSESEQANVDPYVFLNVSAIWNFNENLLTSTSLASSRPYNNSIPLLLEEATCARMEITDTVYKIRIGLNTSLSLSTLDANLDLISFARNITSNSSTISENNGVVSFEGYATVTANMLLSKVTKFTPIECSVDITPAPTPIPQITSGIRRYGVVTDSITGQNRLEANLYGFNSSKANEIFNYNHIDKYSTLVTSDSCFKVKIWIVIPAFFPIVFPLWVDASIVTSVLGAFESALGAATGLLNTALDKARNLKNQVSAKNYLEAQKRNLALAKGLATKDGLIKLANAAKKTAERAKEMAEDYERFKKLYEVIIAIRKLLDTVTNLIDTLSNSDIVSRFSDSESTSDPATLRSLFESVRAISETINTAIETLINLVDALPEGFEIKERIQETIRDIREFIELIKTLTTESIENIVNTGQISPVEIIIQMIEVIFDKRVIRKLFKIVNNLDVVQEVYDRLLNEYKEVVENFGQDPQTANINLINEAIGNEKIEGDAQISALGFNLTGLADAAAAEIDALAGTVSEALGLNQAENLANAGLDLAVSGVGAAADALGSAAEGIEDRKRDEIKGVIGKYLIDHFDLYYVSILANFDNDYPHEKQILINDLSGTKIYANNGTLLFERRDFCKHPFVPLGQSVRLNSNGCQSGRNPCDVGGYNCQEKNYRHDGVKFRVSFDFYDNHDLSKGGVVVGDFDGNGIMDIMCHYPSSTRNYDQITKETQNRTAEDRSDIVENNEIIYSPLLSRNTNGRFESREQVLLLDTGTGGPQPQKHWCKDGVVRIGDFNGDNKDDMLCITPTNNYLIYSQGYSFRPANNSLNGNITLGNITNNVNNNQRQFEAQSSSDNSLSNSLVVIGDFDGDKHSDLLTFSRNDTIIITDIYYGHKEKVFVQNASKTNAWTQSYKSQFDTCHSVGINRIIVADINNDGKDDISCVSADDHNVETIHSTINGQTNPSAPLPAPKSHVVIYVNNVQLHPYTTNQAKNAKQNIRVDYQTHKNLYPADATLITHNKMLPQQKSISDVGISLECLRFTNITSEAHVSFSGEYSVPETLLWNQTNSDRILTVNLDVSATFKGPTLIKVTSSKIPSFEYKLEVVQGGCYNTETVTHTTSINIPYNATAKMYIERNNVPLQGKELEQEAKLILPNFEIENDSVISFPVEGEVTAHMLGVGFDKVNHCGDNV